MPETLKNSEGIFGMPEIFSKISKHFRIYLIKFFKGGNIRKSKNN